MITFRRLPGFPDDGSVARPFGVQASGGWSGYSEGLIVEFVDSEVGCRWIGNFQTGSGCGWNGVVPHPNGEQVLVVANGHGYLVNVLAKTVENYSLIGIQCVLEVPQLHLLLVTDGITIRVFGMRGTPWLSPRIAWDEIRNMQIINHELHGEASGPSTNAWTKFSLDLVTRAMKGGSYEETMTKAVKISKD